MTILSTKQILIVALHYTPASEYPMCDLGMDSVFSNIALPLGFDDIWGIFTMLTDNCTIVDICNEIFTHCWNLLSLCSNPHPWIVDFFYILKYSKKNCNRSWVTVTGLIIAILLSFPSVVYSDCLLLHFSQGTIGGSLFTFKWCQITLRVMYMLGTVALYSF